jgi:hypothetical protein
MGEDWVTLATFENHGLAVFSKSVLEAVGIQCWLRDEHLGRMLGAHSAPFGGIKLQVRPEDVEDAQEALRQSSPVSGDHETTDEHG